MQRFVLIDAYPGMLELVEKSLAKYPAVLKHRPLKDRNNDILAVVEGTDPDSIADYVAGTLRFVDGVYAVRLVDEKEDVAPVVRKAMAELRA